MPAIVFAGVELALLIFLVGKLRVVILVWHLVVPETVRYIYQQLSFRKIISNTGLKERFIYLHITLSFSILFSIILCEIECAAIVKNILCG